MCIKKMVIPTDYSNLPKEYDVGLQLIVGCVHCAKVNSPKDGNCDWQKCSGHM